MTNILTAQDALQYLNADDRQEWYEAAMMLKSEFGCTAFNLWDEWSQQGATYKSSDARAVWKSCKPNGGLTIASLYYRARQNGWNGSRESIQLSPAEIASRDLARQIEQKKAENEYKAKRLKGATKALGLWNSYQPVSPYQKYLVRKGIDPGILRQVMMAAVVPVFNRRALLTLQYIDPDGNKRFMSGGVAKGGYTPIGLLGDVFYICEGYATGATIHQVSGLGVLCALSADNLLSVALQARKYYPLAHIVIAADNDCEREGNPGVTRAREAAMAIGGELIIPEFPPGHPGGDWNDYYLMEKEGLL